MLLENMVNTTCIIQGSAIEHLGHEELGKDVLPLCLFAHWLIHGGHMKAKAPWQPNIIQKDFAFMVQFTTDDKTTIFII